MSERGWRPVLERLAPLVLIIALAAALLLPPLAPLRLADPDRTRAAAFRGVLERLPDEALVLLAFDPDFGTYGEIRFVVRTLIDDLLARGASVAFTSFTPEGRALAVAELDRLDRLEAPPRRIADFGFRTGAEAALLLAVEEIVPPSADGRVAEAVEARGGGLAAFDLTVVVAGNDLGPRAWIEQVGPRLPDLLLAAIAPTYLRAELQPYLDSGQLAALLGTLRETAGYVGAPVDEPLAADAAAEVAPPSAAAIILGMLVALAVMAQAVGEMTITRLRSLVAGRRR